MTKLETKAQAKQDQWLDKASKEFMKRAIDLSEKASLKEKSGGVFGAVIVKDGKIIAEGYNQVAKTHDPTWHAEIQAIREASKKLGTPHLKGCVLYTRRMLPYVFSGFLLGTFGPHLLRCTH